MAGRRLVLEAMSLMSQGRVRCISLFPTDGLSRGMEAINTGRPISVPVGETTLGRMMNVVGEPIDDLGPIQTKERWPIHHKAPPFTAIVPSVEILETGIKVIDLMTPYAKGGKIGTLRRGRSGQDRADHGTDTQHRLRAQRLFRVCRCGGALPEGTSCGRDEAVGVIDKTALDFRPR